MWLVKYIIDSFVGLLYVIDDVLVRVVLYKGVYKVLGYIELGVIVVGGVKVMIWDGWY